MLFNLRDNPLKGFRLVFGKAGEDFAVQLDTPQLEGMDKLAVGEVVRTDGGIDADIPKCAKVSFFVFAMRE